MLLTGYLVVLFVAWQPTCGFVIKQPTFKVDRNHAVEHFTPRVEMNKNGDNDGGFDLEKIVSSRKEDEEDYARKLATAQAAIAAAQEARKKLVSPQEKAQAPPLGSISTLSKTDAGTLVVELPPPGVDSSVVVNGLFSAAWFSAIIPATFATGGAPLLFMLPFWAAGGMVAKSAVVDPFVSSILTIGQYAWSLESTYVGSATLNKKEGPTQQLMGAQMEVAAVVNGVPQCELRLYTSKGVTAMGLGLSQEELEYLADQINDHLAALREQFPDDFSDALTPM